MTRDEFLSGLRARGATIAPPPTNQTQITIANALLQNMDAAMIPGAMFDLYTATGGLYMGSGYIMGPNEIARGVKFPVPSIVEINKNMSHIPGMRGKTIFGRNDLFLFAFDAFGVYYMMDNTTLRVLRKYDDAYRAMTDCLMAGKL